MVGEVAAEPAQLSTRRTGSFGQLSAEVATPMAMVLTEIFQNAAEHGFAGRPGAGDRCAFVSPGVFRSPSTTTVAGCPQTSTRGIENPGLSIVRTLVESELGGVISFGSRPDGGTRVMVDIPLRADASASG